MIRRHSALFSGVLLTVVSMCGCAARDNSHATAPGGDYDLRFLTEVSDHLMHDLRIANACKGKRIKQELTAFCTELHSNQSQEQARMVNMMKQWYDRELHPDPFPLWLEGQDGEVFERGFLKGVLEGHEDMAKKAAQCIQDAKHPELAKLCTSMAEHRRTEAIRMKQWNCEWFKECD